MQNSHQSQKRISGASLNRHDSTPHLKRPDNRSFMRHTTENLAPSVRAGFFPTNKVDDFLLKSLPLNFLRLLSAFLELEAMLL